MPMRVERLRQHNPLKVPIDAQVKRPLLHRDMSKVWSCFQPCSEIRKPQINPRAARCDDTPGIADRIVTRHVEHLPNLFIAMQRLDPAEFIDHVVSTCFWFIRSDADLSISPALQPCAFVGCEWALHFGVAIDTDNDSILRHWTVGYPIAVLYTTIPRISQTALEHTTRHEVAPDMA